MNEPRVPLDLNLFKRKLRSAGFEVYRSSPQRITLAERVRDNLILDSGVSAQLQPELGIVIELRVQASHTPGADEEALGLQLGQLASPFFQLGYQEAGKKSLELTDPGDSERVLDTQYQLHLSRPVQGEDELFSGLRAALSLPRASTDE